MVSWPEIQNYMGNPRWKECIFCQEIEGHPCPDNSYMVPEDLYKEVETIKLYPAEFDLPIGHLRITIDGIELDGIKYTRDENQLNNGSEVILYSPNKGYWTTTCTSYSYGFPPIFEDNSTLIDAEILGIKL
jgi:hypothetical protein